MLAARLKRLETDGLIDRRACSERPLRHEYRLTARSVRLDADDPGAQDL